MKKRILAAALASAMILSVAGCGGAETTTTTAKPAEGEATTTTAAPAEGETTTEAAAPAEVTFGEQGKVFNIYAWNDEYQKFFQKYYEGSLAISDNGTPDDTTDDIFYDKPIGVPAGVTVNWIINPSDNGVYQEKLDAAIMAQATAAADDKIDMFLAEADYIIKYVDSDATMDIAELGLGQAATEYQYTVDAATDANGKIKGVSFQCCPSALIYRRSVAEAVLGTSDPAEVQKQLDSWDKFEAVAATAKEKGYYMTASYIETYRIFANSAEQPWVDGDKNLSIDGTLEQYLTQAEKFLKNEYTLPAGIWDDEKTQQMFATGTTMCFFGPAWYYNFCMGNAHDAEKGTMGDWAVIEGPQAHFWGGTWLLAAAGSDNQEMLKSVFEAFTVNEDICSALIKNENQFTNNTTVNQKFADDPAYGNEFLGGQNDTALFVELAKNIKFENRTPYGQLLNEKLPSYFLDFFKGTITKDQAYANFYAYVNETYPAIVTP